MDSISEADRDRVADYVDGRFSDEIDIRQELRMELDSDASADAFAKKIAEKRQGDRAEEPARHEWTSALEAKRIKRHPTKGYRKLTDHKGRYLGYPNDDSLTGRPKDHTIYKDRKTGNIVASPIGKDKKIKLLDKEDIPRS